METRFFSRPNRSVQDLQHWAMGGLVLGVAHDGPGRPNKE